MKRKVRIFFGLVIFLFVVGLLITKIIDEPYPAIIYPSFATIPTVARSIKEHRLKVFFHNNDSLQINAEDLFYGMSKNFISIILKENFTANNSFLKRLKTRNDFNESIRSNQSDIQTKKKLEETTSWIKSRLIKSLKRSDIGRLEVQWYNILDSANNVGTDNLVEKVAVELN